MNDPFYLVDRLEIAKEKYANTLANSVLPGRELRDDLDTPVFWACEIARRLRKMEIKGYIGHRQAQEMILTAINPQHWDVAVKTALEDCPEDSPTKLSYQRLQYKIEVIGNGSIKENDAHQNLVNILIVQFNSGGIGYSRMLEEIHDSYLHKHVPRACMDIAEHYTRDESDKPNSWPIAAKFSSHALGLVVVDYRNCSTETNAWRLGWTVGFSEILGTLDHKVGTEILQSQEYRRLAHRLGAFYYAYSAMHQHLQPIVRKPRRTRRTTLEDIAAIDENLRLVAAMREYAVHGLEPQFDEEETVVWPPKSPLHC